MIRLCAFADEASSILDGQIAALKRNGIYSLELRSVDGKNVKDISVTEAKEYRERLDRAGISVFSIGSPIGKSDIDEEIDKVVAEARHIFTLANIFGAKKIRMFSFFKAYEKPDEVISRLRLLIEIAKEYGLTLCHENEKEIYGDTPERVSLLLDEVKGLSSVYDPANYVQVGASGDEFFPLSERAEYFHIKDVIKETGELVPAGYGDGRLQELIASLPEDAVISIEPHLAVFDGYASIDNSEMKHKFNYNSNDEAFDAAVSAVRDIFKRLGYTERDGGFIKL